MALRLWVKEFASLGAQLDALKERRDSIKARLVEAVDKGGTRDDKGHVWLELDEPIGGLRALKRERRAPRVPDEERIEEVLKDKGLTERCYRAVTDVVLDEDEVMAAHYEGLLTEDEIDSMFPVKETFAFVPVKER